MCFSFEASIATWVVCLIVFAYLWYRNLPYDRTFALLILFYSQIQLFEAGIWATQSPDRIQANLVFTRLAYIILFSHIFAIGLGLYLYDKTILIPLILGSILFLYGIVSSFFIKYTPTLKSASGCSLEYSFPTGLYVITIVLGILFALWYIKPLSKALLVIGFFALMALLAVYLQSKGEKSWSSRWCFFAAAFSFLVILINR